MARPQKEGLDYFPHDVHLSIDEKIEDLEAVYKNDGYAVYLKLLERIYLKGGMINISVAETRQKYARKFHIDDFKKFDEMIDLMAKLGLFNEKLWKRSKVLTSEGVKKRMQPVIEKRVLMKERYAKRISASETKQKRHKVKESKEKKSKEKNIPPEKPPISSEEIQHLKDLQWSDQKIKDHFIGRGYPEAEIDVAMGKRF